MNPILTLFIVLAAFASSKPKPNMEKQLAGISIPQPMDNKDWEKLVASAQILNYTVQTGDTLWGIAGKFASNPRLWRKLWELNPDLTNPHDLTKGQVIKIYQIAPERTVTAVPEPQVPVVKLTPPAGTPTVSGEEMGVKSVPDLFRPRVVVFDSPDFALGEISGSFSAGNVLTEQSEIFVDFQDRPQAPGTRLSIGHKDEELMEKTPDVGILVRVQGEIEVESRGEKLTKCKLINVNGPILRGDKVIPLQSPVQWAERSNPPDGLSAKVLAGEQHERSFFARGELVFLDKGNGDGLRVGQQFRVAKVQDPRTEKESTVEPLFKGELVIVNLAEHTSVAYITASSDPITAGDGVLPYQKFESPPPPPKRNAETLHLD